MNRFKKFLFFVNDVSNTALEKDKARLEKNNRRLKNSLIFAASLLILSLLFKLFGLFN